MGCCIKCRAVGASRIKTCPCISAPAAAPFFRRSRCPPTWRQPQCRRLPTQPPASWPPLLRLLRCLPAAAVVPAHRLPCRRRAAYRPPPTNWCRLLWMARLAPPRPLTSSGCARPLGALACRCRLSNVLVWLCKVATCRSMALSHPSSSPSCLEQSPGTPAQPLATHPAAPTSPFQAASASLPAGPAGVSPAGGSQGGAGGSSLTAKLLQSLGPAVQPPPAQQLLQQAVPAPAQRSSPSGAVPLHFQLASSGRLAVGSSVESASHLPPSPFATEDRRSPECGSPFTRSGEPSLALPGLPEGIPGLGCAQNAAAAAAAAAGDMPPLLTGVPASRGVHEAPSFEFSAAWPGCCGASALPPAPPLMLPECPPALGLGASPLRRSPTPGLDASLAPAVSTLCLLHTSAGVPRAAALNAYPIEPGSRSARRHQFSTTASLKTQPLLPPPQQVVAKIISGLPSLNLFAADGPLGVGAVAELEATPGAADGERKVRSGGWAPLTPPRAYARFHDRNTHRASTGHWRSQPIKPVVGLRPAPPLRCRCRTSPPWARCLDPRTWRCPTRAWTGSSCCG